jgi:hypothetical protein
MLITKNAELVSISICNLKKVGYSKLNIQLYEMFNYLIWCDTKMLNKDWSFVRIIVKW